MGNSHEDQSTQDRSTKRERFTDSQNRRRKPAGASPLVLVAGLLVVAAIISSLAYALGRPSPQLAASPASTPSSASDPVSAGSQNVPVRSATLGHRPYPQIVAENGVVSLPLSTFDDRIAHYYTYMHEGQPIEFFVLESRDGVVRAAFNACDVCFDARKGYTQDGDVMVCNSCGSRFPADQINVVQGGCNPSPLQRAVSGEQLVISVEDLVAGSVYF